MVCCGLISFVWEWSQWRFLVNTVMNLLFTLKTGHLLTSGFTVNQIWVVWFRDVLISLKCYQSGTQNNTKIYGLRVRKFYEKLPAYLRRVGKNFTLICFCKYFCASSAMISRTYFWMKHFMLRTLQVRMWHTKRVQIQTSSQSVGRAIPLTFDESRPCPMMYSILVNLNGSITMCPQRNIILYSVRQHNHFITLSNTRLHVSTSGLY